MYIIELHECDRFESFIKFLGYSEDLDLIDKYEKIYEDSEDYYIIVSKVEKLN